MWSRCRRSIPGKRSLRRAQPLPCCAMPSASTASKQNRSSRPGAYGQMVVSCWPLGATQIHDITHAKREPRRAIEVEIATPTGAFRLIAAHFGLTLTERRQQARRLVAIARPHAMTTVMLGDFNEWFWPASMRGALGRELPARTQHLTFPSWYPLFRLDRIFCWPSGAMRKSFVDREARVVSDHLPVVADIDIGA